MKMNPESVRKGLSLVDAYRRTNFYKLMTGELERRKKLEEGLIVTRDIGTTVYMLRKYGFNNSGALPFHDSELADISPIGAQNKIRVVLDHTQLEGDSIDGLLRMMNNLGWFPSVYFIRSSEDAFKWTGADKFKGDVSGMMGAAIDFEAKYDLEVDLKNVEELYHVTPANKVARIKAIGLSPKSGSKISAHPDRVYFALSRDAALGLVDQLAKYVQGQVSNYVLLKIDVDKLPKNIKVYSDVDFFPVGVYTYSNIHPGAITVEAIE